MIPADDVAVEHLVGKRVAFKDDAAHAGCWHHRVGLRSARVLRPGQSLAKKAELLEAEGLVMPEAVPEEDTVTRVWVFADPCASFPQGCETAVEKDCLCLMDA
jgi:hypothetical protein